MKIFIRKTIFFIILILLTDLIIGNILRYYYYKQTNGNYARITYALEKTSEDLLIFGSSRATHHYVPQVFEEDSLNFSYYNVGKDGQSIVYQLAVLKSTLIRYTPKIIILDIRPGEFEYQANVMDKLSILLPYYKNHPELKNLIHNRSTFEKYKLLSSIYPYNSLMVSIMAGNIESVKEKSIKGYVPLYGIWSKELKKSYKSKPIDDFMLSQFNEFLITTKKSNCKLYVIISPIYLKYEVPDETIETVKIICKKEGVSFYDYSNDMLFLKNKKYFKDILHLNNEGAKLFSEIINDKIKASYINKNCER